MTREGTYLDLPDGLDLRIRTSVMKLDPAAKTAKLSGGDELSFEHAVLATGANVKRVRVDGCDLDGIHYLRTLGNSDAIRADAAERRARRAHRRLLHRLRGRRVADRRGQASCTLVMQEDDAALARLRAHRRREFFAGVLREHGIDWVANDALERFEGRRPRRARS